MADLTVDGKPSDLNKEPVKTKQTERKPIVLDKPQDVSQQIQVHQGNIGVLQVKLLEMATVELKKIRELLEKKP